MFQKNSKTIWLVFILCFICFNSSGGLAEEKMPADPHKYVSIDFNDVDIRVFIKFISELTKENFIIDNRVKGKVNILSPGKITIERNGA